MGEKMMLPINYPYPYGMTFKTMINTEVMGNKTAMDIRLEDGERLACFEEIEERVANNTPLDMEEDD